MRVELKYKHKISKITSVEIWEDEDPELLKILVRGRLRFLGYSTYRGDNLIKIKHIKDIETNKRMR